MGACVLLSSLGTTWFRFEHGTVAGAPLTCQDRCALGYTRGYILDPRDWV